jgi:hypothetical protein
MAEENIKRKAFGGVLWSYANTFGVQLLQLIPAPAFTIRVWAYCDICNIDRFCPNICQLWFFYGIDTEEGCNAYRYM